jgi:arylsulfatase A-like enzyme
MAAMVAVSACAPQAAPETPTAKPAHVVIVGFDNYHWSDIQRAMPNLAGFIQKGAWTGTTHHPSLPTRTAPGFASIASGQYPDRHGAILNSFQAPAGTPRVGFAYWENLAKLQPPPFLTEPPWVAFNKAGYDVGAIGFQGLVMENKAEAQGYLGRTLTDEQLDQYWGVALHKKDGSTAFGTLEIPVLKELVPSGWLNGWAGPPLKSAAITLPMATALLRSGVDVLFVYVENTHQRCVGSTAASCFGNLTDGSFDDLLKSDDDAFGQWFADLARAGVTTANTLFVFTTDEGDRYLPSFAKVIDTTSLQPATNGAAGLFYGSDADALGSALGKLPNLQGIATKTAMKALRIGAGDPRTPTYAAFPDADAYFNRGPCTVCGRWNHGTIHPDINDIWLGLVGAGVRPGALAAFTDHPDIVATARAALGIAPTADLDGVPILPALSRSSPSELLQARDVYKQLVSPFGSLAKAILRISTDGVRGGADARAKADARIADLMQRRDVIAGELRPAIDGTAQRSAQQLTDAVGRANALMAEAGK